MSSLLSCRLYDLAWSTDISDSKLTFTNNNTTAKRASSVSCYPAAFSKLQSERAKFTVRLDATNLTGNWLSFGLAKKGMSMSGSDGLGRTENTWGLFDERSSGSVSKMAAVSACKTNVGTLPRKLKDGDVLSGEADVAAGWFEVRLNQSEFAYRFTIPVGSKEDYWFGMTFANDHQATIVASGTSAAPSPQPSRATLATPATVLASTGWTRALFLFRT
jgi:hypothetical protein